MMEANNDSAIQFELRSESLQEQLDAANQRIAELEGRLSQIEKPIQYTQHEIEKYGLTGISKYSPKIEEAAERKLAMLNSCFDLLASNSEIRNAIAEWYASYSVMSAEEVNKLRPQERLIRWLTDAVRNNALAQTEQPR